jgi:acetolactate synthase small subunit
MSNKMDFEGLTFQVGGLEVAETTWTQIAAVADLDQDISATYVEAEVQAISDKVDALLAAMRTAGLLAS